MKYSLRRRTLFEWLEVEKKDFWLVVNDVGHQQIPQALVERLGRQYINIGITEPSLPAFVSGLAAQEKPVIVYGISPFIFLRCLEGFSLHILAKAAPALFVGSGVGAAYQEMGFSHWAHQIPGVLCALGASLHIPLRDERLIQVLQGFFRNPRPTSMLLSDMEWSSASAFFLDESRSSQYPMITYGRTAEVLSQYNLPFLACEELPVSGMSAEWVVEESFGSGPLSGVVAKNRFHYPLISQSEVALTESEQRLQFGLYELLEGLKCAF